MPVQPCREDGRPGYKWGKEGRCYTYVVNKPGAKERAKEKAIKQGLVIKSKR